MGESPGLGGGGGDLGSTFVQMTSNHSWLLGAGGLGKTGHWSRGWSARVPQDIGTREGNDKTGWENRG